MLCHCKVAPTWVPRWIFNMRHYVSFAALLALLLLSGLGCSAALNWDPENLKCNDAGLCEVGYSCLAPKCIRDHSKALHQACVQDRQCTEGLVCPHGAFTCMNPCTAYLSGS